MATSQLISARTPAVAPTRRRLLSALPEAIGLLACIGLYTQTYALETDVDGPGPAFFPRLVLLFLAAGLGVVLVKQLRGVVADEQPATMHWSRFALGVALSLGYIIGTYQFGWTIATAVFLVVFIRAAGHRRVFVSMPFAVLVSLGLTYVCVKVVYISLPTGVGIFDALTDRVLDLVGIY